MSESETPQYVVAGIDESDHSTKAAQWAAQYASDHGLELRLVHGLNFPANAALVSPVPVKDAKARAYGYGNKLLDSAREALAADHPQLAITTEVDEVSAAVALIESSKQAQLLVVGSHGHGGFSGLLIGSITYKVATHASCPVVIVR